MKQQENPVPGTMATTSTYKSNNKMNTDNCRKTSVVNPPETVEGFHRQSLLRRWRRNSQRLKRTENGVAYAFLHSLLSILTFPSILPTCRCRWLTIPTQLLSITPSLGRKVTGTLFGRRGGHVSFAVQEEPSSETVFMVELAISTSTLLKEMSSGMVRIALEWDVTCGREPVVWKMYCNGRKCCGYAVSRESGESDWHVMSTLQRVSVGAGVMPAPEGEVLYMRARFERVVGSRDSEAFYMLNPDGRGGAELSIFLIIRI